MKKLLLPLLFALAAVTLFQGCSSNNTLIGLQVQLVKLERKADGTLLASLQFSNPTVGSLNVFKSTHQLTLGGRPAGELEVVEPLGLPALQTVTTTATFRHGSRAADVSGPVSYRLESLLTLSIFNTTEQLYKTSSAGTVTVP